MHTLVKSILDRDVELNGSECMVRSPTVREALTVLASAPGTLAEEKQQRKVFYDALRSWLPQKLYDGFNQRDYPDERVVALVYCLVNEGVPEFKEALTAQDDESMKPSHRSVADGEINWENVIADYMSTYKMSLREVLDEPWNGFLLMSRKADMIHARESLRMLGIRGLPYIKDERNRKAVMDDIIRRAGGHVDTQEEKRTRDLAAQQGQLDIVAKQFGQCGLFVGGDKPEA